MAIDGVGWDWSYMANYEDNHALVAKKEAPTEFVLMANISAENGKLAGFQTASKDLDSLLESQRLDKNKEGLGYSDVPPSPAQIYSSPKKDMSWTGLTEFKDDTVTIYSRHAPTVESSLDDAQNKNPFVTKTEASPSTISPKSFIKFVKANDSPTKSKIEKAKKAKKSPVKVLVNKSQNKTPYELFNGRTPTIGFLKPFGYHVMILNTLDNLGKFEAKGDEGHFIGYSMSSKAFRVFNKRTRKVEENWHVDFLENKAIEKGAGPNWLFDIDSLTKSMNYVPVDAGTTSTNLSGIKDAANQEVKKNVSSLRYIALPNWVHDALLESSSSKPQDDCSTDVPKSSRNSNLTATSTNPPADQLETLTVENPIPTVSSPVLTAFFTDSLEPSSDARLISKRVANQVETPSLDNILTLANRFEDILEVTTNLDEPNEVEADDLEFPAKVYKVEKAMYGLHQAPRAWYVLQKEDGIFLSQDKYVGDILKKFRYSDVRSSNTSMDKENPWGKDRTRKDVDLHLYRSMIVSLMYLTASRPDIMFAVCACARHQVTPKECHLHAVKRIFRYLKGHPKLGLWYRKESPFDLVAYSDSDYGGATQDHKSTTGGCQFLGRRLISWQCKKQTIMATSTTEAEYVAAASCCGQVMWIQNQLLDYGLSMLCEALSRKISTSILCLCLTIDARLHTAKTFDLVWMWLGGDYGNVFLIGEGSGTPTEPHHTPFPEVASSHPITSSIPLPSIPTAPFPTVTQPNTTPIIQYSRRVRIGQSSALPTVANEPASPVRDDKGTKILAIIDGILRTVTESSLRINLKLQDEEGISSLPDMELFENLTLIGYNISPNQKFTFQKGQFSHQWKYLIHTIMQCLGPKSTGFNEFSSNIATALVCLATDRTYNFSKVIFDGLVKNVNNKGEDSGTPTEPHHTPSLEAHPTSHTTYSSPKLPPVTTASIPTVTSSETTPIRDVSECEACPTDSGLGADQDRATIAKTSTLPLDSAPRVTSPAAAEGSMQQTLNELTVFCTSLQRQHSKLISKFEAQELEINRLKARVKLLEDREGVAAEIFGDDALIKGRNLDEGEAAAERVSDDTEDMAAVLTSMDAATVLASGVADVPTGSGSIPTASPLADEVPTRSDVVPIKKKIQEQMDIQMARQLEEEIERDDRSNETVAKYLQEYQQFDSELPLERRIELISDLVRYQDNYAKVHKYQSQQRKPWSKKQKRDYYMAVIKSNLGWIVKDFRGMRFEEVKAKFTTVWKQLEDFIPMGSKEEAERLKRKGLSLEQESVKKLKTSKEVAEEVKSPDEVPKEKITRLGGSSASYQFFIDLLKHLDREDLNQLWALVKESLSNMPPTSDKEIELWVELKRLYKPDDEDQLWIHTQNLMHALVEWKLYDTCGVHHVTAKDKEIFMLVEKDYPLKKVIEFPLAEEVPTASEESYHCQKKRKFTAVMIALLLKSRRNCQSKTVTLSADNRPPMLEKDMYDSWKSRMELYMLNRPHGRMILESVKQGPLIWPSVEVEGVTRLKKYSELSAAEAIQADCDVKATNIILQGLPPEVYALKGETLRDFYLKFSLLLNDMNMYNIKLEQFQVNTKFLNTLPSEWSKFVTDVKLVRDLHTTNVDQLHAYLGQHEYHANEVRLMNEQTSDPLALISQHQLNSTPYPHHPPLYKQSQFQPQATSYQSSPYGTTYHNS
nr:hypothetical protein [Tanacetum cinerariifolium]